MLKISLPKTKSKNYNKAIDVAQRFEGFEQSTNKIFISDDADIFRWLPNLFELIEICQKWNGFSFNYNGREVTPFLFYQAIDSLKNCFTTDFINAPNKERYCWHIPCHFEGWGCKKLVNLKRHLDGAHLYKGNKYWYNYGNFTNPNTWEVDKMQIAQVLQNEIMERAINLCPKFDVKNMLEVINNLPDTITIDKVNYECFYKHDFKGSSFAPVAINIRHKFEGQLYTTDSPYVKYPKNEGGLTAVIGGIDIANNFNMN